MSWLQIRIDSAANEADAAEDILLELGAAAVTLEDSADQPIFEPPPGATPLWQATRVTGLFPASSDVTSLLAAIHAAGYDPIHCRGEILEDRDWEREWMENYHPMRFGERLWVCPSWREPPEPSAVNLMLDPGLATLIRDLDDRGLLDETLVVAVGEFGRSPKMGISTSGNGNSKDGRDHWPYCYTAVIAGAGIKRGNVHGKSDATASGPLENGVDPQQLLATVYHAVGLNPSMMIYNHLNQPREMVKGEPVLDLFA